MEENSKIVVLYYSFGKFYIIAVSARPVSHPIQRGRAKNLLSAHPVS